MSNNLKESLKNKQIFNTKLKKELERILRKPRSYWLENFKLMIVDMITSNDDNLAWYGTFLTRFGQQIDISLKAPAGVYYNMAIDDKKKSEGYTLVINPAMFALFSREEQIAILKHEVSHVINLHFFRMTAEKGFTNHELNNIAMDIAINGSKDKPFIKNLPGSKGYEDSLYGGVFSDILDDFVNKGILKSYKKEMNAEYYYSIMKNANIDKELEKIEYNKNQHIQQNNDKNDKPSDKTLEKTIDRIQNTNDRIDKQQNDEEITQEKIKELQDFLDKLKEINNTDQQSQQSQQNSQSQSNEQQSQQSQQNSQSQSNEQQSQQSQQSQQNSQSQSNEQQCQQGQSGQSQSSQQDQQSSLQSQSNNSQNSNNGEQSRETGEKGESLGQSIKDVKKDSHKNKQGKGSSGESVENSSHNQNLEKEYNDLVSEVARELAKAIIDGKLKSRHIDDHSLQEKNKPDGVTNESFEKMALSDLQEMIKTTTKQNGRGFQPAEIDNCLLEIAKRLKVQVRWDKVLRKSIGNIISRKKVINSSRVNHLLYPEDPNTAGYVKGKEPLVTVIMDVSGSMTDSEIIMGVNEVKDIARKFGAEVKLVQVDTMVHEVTNVSESLKKINRSATGGTYLQPGFEFIMDPKNKMGKPQVIVCITDGGCESDFNNGFTLPKDVHVIWLATQGLDNLAFNVNNYHNMKAIHLDLSEFEKDLNNPGR